LKKVIYAGHCRLGFERANFFSLESFLGFEKISFLALVPFQQLSCENWGQSITKKIIIITSNLKSAIILAFN
jgi:hypothetical protein